MLNFYFYDHITSWLTLIIQFIAFCFAAFEYYNWKSKANSQSEHKNLVQLFECVTQLKIALIEFEDSLHGRAIFVKVFDQSNKEKNLYKLHQDIHDLFDNLVAEVLVSTKTKSQIIYEIFGLEEVHTAVEKLISHAEDEKSTISRIVQILKEENPRLPKIKKRQKIESFYQKIKTEIKSSSKILD